MSMAVDNNIRHVLYIDKYIYMFDIKIINVYINEVKGNSARTLLECELFVESNIYNIYVFI